jgi:hypothetical protein
LQKTRKHGILARTNALFSFEKRLELGAEKQPAYQDAVKPIPEAQEG